MQNKSLFSTDSNIQCRNMDPYKGKQHKDPENEYGIFLRQALLTQTQDGENEQQDNIFREVKIQNLLRYLEEKKINFCTLQRNWVEKNRIKM